VKSILAVSALTLMLSGCALARAYTALTDASVSPQVVIVAANAFDAVEATAKNILVACTPASRPSACNDVQLTTLIGAVRAGRDAREGLEGFLAAHPGQLGSQGLYDALTGATVTITAAINDYNGAKS
jgi:hypothetical protein